MKIISFTYYQIKLLNSHHLLPLHNLVVILYPQQHFHKSYNLSLQNKWKLLEDDEIFAPYKLGIH